MKSSVLVILGLRCLGPSKWKCCNGSNGAPWFQSWLHFPALPWLLYSVLQDTALLIFLKPGLNQARSMLKNIQHALIALRIMYRYLSLVFNPWFIFWVSSFSLISCSALLSTVWLSQTGQFSIPQMYLAYSCFQILAQVFPFTWTLFKLNSHNQLGLDWNCKHMTLDLYGCWYNTDTELLL